MSDVQRQAALLGAVLLLIGFATGGLLWMATTGKLSADADALLAAHRNALLGCFWLCAVAFTLPLTRFEEAGARRLVLLSAIPAYASWLLTVVKAFLHVAGLGLSGSGGSGAVFVALNVLVVLPSFGAALTWAYGLASRRAA